MSDCWFVVAVFLCWFVCFFLLPCYLLDQIILLYGRGAGAGANTPEFLRYSSKFA